MSSYNIVHEEVHPSRSARRGRDPLQIPIVLSFDEDRALPRVLEMTRDFALWLAIVFGAALGVFFVGANVPELRAAAHGHAGETPSIVDSAPPDRQVR
jgi:hypothetical protein